MRLLSTLAAAAVIFCSTLTAEAATVRIEAQARASSVEGAYRGLVALNQVFSFVIEYDAALAPTSTASFFGSDFQAIYQNVTRFDITTAGTTLSALAPGGPGQSIVTEDTGFAGLTFQSNQNITLAGIPNTSVDVSISGLSTLFNSANPAPTAFDFDAVRGFQFAFSLTSDPVNNFVRVSLFDEISATLLDDMAPIPLPAGLPLLLGGLGLLAIARRRRA